ncbi:MAG: aminotransferase class I/II-fold pyridoxal phosphate-dependent enzyme, partial [Clostridia bacterium]|nr:aminotransferase class I/II-fold pyridoxal phosphate-dependent enzyme [Clostridia bacterium]
MDYDKILCRRVAQVPPSGIRKFFDIASEMQDVISLGVGEPDFTTPWRCSDAAIYSLRQGRTHYTSNRGLKELCRLISAYEERFGVEYDPQKEILTTVGASEGIDLALRALLEPGDEVLIPDPSYVSYMPCVTFSGGVCVPVPTSAENGFIITPEMLAPLITPRTKALILPYPNNPTGGIMDESAMEKPATAL